jgi:hypothetical protein
VQSPDTFYKWFHSTNETKVIPYSITLTPLGGRLYSYLVTSLAVERREKREERREKREERREREKRKERSFSRKWN